MAESLQYFKNYNAQIMGAKYLQGVPGLNNPFTAKFVPDANGIHILDASTGAEKAYINKEDITAISVEDQTTIEKRVGFARLLMVGIFAFAWKKKQTNPLAFLIIEFRNEFGEINEMYFQTEKKSGFQDLTNLKYFIQKYWQESQLPNFNDLKRASDEIKAQEMERNKKIKYFLIAAAVLFIIYRMLTKN